MAVSGSPKTIWRRIGVEAGIVLSIAVLLTLTSWLFRTPRFPLLADQSVYEFELQAPLVSPGEALQFYEEGSHLFIDIGEGDDGRYIPGAFFIRSGSFEDDLRDVIDFISLADPLIIYGGGDLQTVSALAARFKERGYLNLWLLDGGFPAWLSAGGDSEQGDMP